MTYSMKIRLQSHLQIMRIDHWVKNVFVLPGIFVAATLGYSSNGVNIFWSILTGFVAISLVSSSYYTLNEVLLLLKLHGVPNADDLIELMYPDGEYEPNRASQQQEKQEQQQALAAAKPAPMMGAPQQAKPGAVKEALERLSSVIEKAKEVARWN